MSTRQHHLSLLAVVAALCGSNLAAESALRGSNEWARDRKAAPVLSLDRGQWLVAADPDNCGREKQWWARPAETARPARVPGVVQEVFPGYHGVAWYWHTFKPMPLSSSNGRYLLRFWAVDYKADVWVNGEHVGGHETGESPFVLDVTDAIKRTGTNLLTVRVLNPTHDPIDGITLNQTPHGCKSIPFRPGAEWNYGGIVDSVELIACGTVRIGDLVVRPDWRTGAVSVVATAQNFLTTPARRLIELSIAPASSGDTVCRVHLLSDLSPGDSLVEGTLKVADPLLWDLNAPHLYRVTAGVSLPDGAVTDEFSTRCGFRDFRCENGYFRLNGRRIYLKSAHHCMDAPLGQRVPHDPDLFRRDLINMKVMGYNMVRFHPGSAARYMLDLCDEIGLMVYEQALASWQLADSPRMGELFDRSTLGMVHRDRNHPAIVAWGLLNETPDGAVFRHAVDFLPKLRDLDPMRLVFLNSGRWDSSTQPMPGLEVVNGSGGLDPCIARNPSDGAVSCLNNTWQAGEMSLHPGPAGEYSVVRWQAPTAGQCTVKAAFKGLGRHTTTDVHILHNGRAIFDSFVNLHGQGNAVACEKTVAVTAGDRLDLVVGCGNGDYGGDTTGLAAMIRTSDGQEYDAAKEFTARRNPNGAWSYGFLAAGQNPDVATFALYAKARPKLRPGTLANPGSEVWEDAVGHPHHYFRVPHMAGDIEYLRTIKAVRAPDTVGPLHGDSHKSSLPDETATAWSGVPNVFLGEYGIGTAVDLVSAMRHFEQQGAAESEDAKLVKSFLDSFSADWRAWRMEETFASPEDYFRQCLRKGAHQRTLGLNAIRSNPHIVGYNVTGGIDHLMTGEGQTTLFRDLKPGLVDAMFDGFSPLRLCLFVARDHIYRAEKTRFEAVLANEDVLRPGDYAVRLQIIGPDLDRVMDKEVGFTIPQRDGHNESPFAMPIFSQEVVVEGPSGKYRFVGALVSGGAAAGGETEFYVTDPAGMPRVEGEVSLWGEDAELAAWLTTHGARVRQFDRSQEGMGDVILAASKPPAPGGAAAFQELLALISRGATVIFLCPEVFAEGNDPAAHLPIGGKRGIGKIFSWIYLKDEWAKRHPIFEGMPAGGLMDHAYYGPLLRDTYHIQGDDVGEAVAGEIKTSQGYESGLTVAVYRQGKGRFIVNTLQIRPHLGRHPAADRLLLNMLRYGCGQ